MFISSEVIGNMADEKSKGTVKSKAVKSKKGVSAKAKSVVPSVEKESKTKKTASAQVTGAAKSQPVAGAASQSPSKYKKPKKSTSVKKPGSSAGSSKKGPSSKFKNPTVSNEQPSKPKKPRKNTTPVSSGKGGEIKNAGQNGDNSKRPSPHVKPGDHTVDNSKNGGKKKNKAITVAEIGERLVAGVDKVRKELIALYRKKGEPLEQKDIQNATKYLEFTGDEMMDFQYSLISDDGLEIKNENGKLIDPDSDDSEDLDLDPDKVDDDMEDFDEDEDKSDQDSLDDDDEMKDDGDEDEDDGDDDDDDDGNDDDQEGGNTNSNGAVEVVDSAPDNSIDSKNMDSVKMYLHEIGQYPILNNKNEEAELARQIKAGIDAQSQLDKAAKDPSHPLDPKVKKNLEYAVEDGNDAREKLTNCNLKLVVSIAKHYGNRGLGFLDLISEGNLGLNKAVSKFDYKRGFKFSTYATWWIRQAITRALADQARIIRIPVHMVETINKIGRTQRKLVQKLNRDPTADEVAKDLNYVYSPDKIREIQQTGVDPLSLEKPVGEEADSHIGDFIEDKENESPADYANNALLKEKLNEVLDDLSERERLVIKLRYGIDNEKTQTLEEVGKRFNVTRERIRQIEAKAIKKLRQPKRANILKDFRNSD